MPHSLHSGRTIEEIGLRLIIWAVSASAGCLAMGRLSADEVPPKGGAAEAPISEKEANQFGKELADTVAKADFDRFDQLVDWGAIVDAAIQIPNLPELKKARGGFKTGIIRTLTAGQGFAAQVNSVVKQGGTYKFLRCDTTAKEPTATCRLTMPASAGLNYHRYLLTRGPGGKVVAKDFYVLVSAERISETLHRGWLPIAKNELKQTLGKAESAADPYIANLDNIQKFTQQALAGKNSEALAIYYALPDELRRAKNFLVIRYKVAGAISPEELSKCVDDFQKYHAHDPALSFLMVDGYFLRQDYAPALKCVDQTIAGMGRDAALLTLRGNVLAAMQKTDEARKTIKEAQSLEPDYRGAFDAGLEMALNGKNFDEAAALLTILTSRFGINWKDVRELPEFADFVKSPQYQKWAASTGN